MKTQLLKQFLKGAVALFLIISLTSCLEESTTVKVNKDGSGIIHTRKYENTEMGDGIFGNIGGDAEADKDKEKEPDVPTEDELKEIAKSMGEGVTFKSITKGKNKAGWSGYEVIYAFEDINKVKLEFNMSDTDQASDPEAAEEGEPEFVTFELNDGLLKIKTPDPAADAAADEENPEEQAVEGAQDPFEDDAQSAQMMAMMAPMFAGARMGFFVEIDGEIAETNAKHREGQMITVMRADLGKLFSNPKAVSELEKIEGDDRDEIQKAVDSIEGIDMDMQDPIEVRFK